MSDVRSKAGAPVASDFTSPNGTPIVINTTAGSVSLSVVDSAGAIQTLSLVSATTKYVRRKALDESINTSTTLQNDDDLVFPIAASEEWVADVNLDVGAALVATGFKVAITVPAGATMSLCAVASAFPGVNTFKRTTTSGAALDYTIVTAVDSNSSVRLFLRVLNSTTAGSVQVQWAQSTSSGTDVTVRAGSFLVAEKV